MTLKQNPLAMKSGDIVYTDEPKVRRRKKMRIVAFSDTHGSHEDIDVPDGDVLIFAGDMACSGALSDYEDFARWFDAWEHPTKIIVAGNHDGKLVKPEVTSLFNAFYMQDAELVRDGVKFYGSPWTPTFLDWHFMKKRGNDIMERWNQIPEDTDVLITHGPPLGMLDSNGRQNCGCYDLNMAVERVKPKLHIFGHIHDNYGKDDNKDTVFANVSMLDENYAFNDRPPMVFDV